MSSINFATREISCKVVYYGPGLSGKTTNLQVIHQKMPQDKRTDMVSHGHGVARNRRRPYLVL